jgi:hypothetical protein
MGVMMMLIRVGTVRAVVPLSLLVRTVVLYRIFYNVSIN